MCVWSSVLFRCLQSTTRDYSSSWSTKNDDMSEMWMLNLWSLISYICVCVRENKDLQSSNTVKTLVTLLLFMSICVTVDCYLVAAPRLPLVWGGRGHDSSWPAVLFWLWLGKHSATHSEMMFFLLGWFVKGSLYCSNLCVISIWIYSCISQIAHW